MLAMKVIFYYVLLQMVGLFVATFVGFFRFMEGPRIVEMIRLYINYNASDNKMHTWSIMNTGTTLLTCIAMLTLCRL
jgi:hypothetical protein